MFSEETRETGFEAVIFSKERVLSDIGDPVWDRQFRCPKSQIEIWLKLQVIYTCGQVCDLSCI